MSSPMFIRHLSSYNAQGLLILYRARLNTRKFTALEFAFGLKPIVQIMVWLFAAFEIDFVCATSDVLVTRQVPYPGRWLVRLRRGGLWLCTFISLRSRWHTHLSRLCDWIVVDRRSVFVHPCGPVAPITAINS